MRTTKTIRIEKLKPRAARYAVGLGSGLQVVVHPTGRKSFVFRYEREGRQESMTLGSLPRTSETRARRMAKMARDAIELGGNPAEDRRREKSKGDARATVREFGQRWLREVVERDRKDARPVSRILWREVYPVIGRRPVSRVTAAEVRQLVFAKRDLGRPAAARALRETLKRLFSYARTCGLTESNPMEATPARFVATLRPRSRVLSEAELWRFFAVLADGESLPGWARCMLELLLLTLARKSELRLARWEHVDLGRGLWEIPGELTKTGKPHIVYLSERALRLFRNRANWHIHLYGRCNSEIAGCTVEHWIDQRAFVFAAHSSATQPMAETALNKAMARVKWGIPKFTPHDLRRTASTILHEKGCQADWIEAALNHSIRGIRGVYNRAQYAEQRRTMLAEWAEYLKGLKHG